MIPNIPGIPSEMFQAAANQAGPMQKELFAFLAKKVQGKSVYRSKSFKGIGEVVSFMNERKDIHIIAVLPDMVNYSYHVVYEEVDQ